MTLRCLALALLTACPALADSGGEKVLIGVVAYLLYALIVVCLVGWSFLVTVLVRRRVELTARILQKRPLASFAMGVLSLGWLILSLVIGGQAGGLGGVLVLVTLSILILCALVGMPAILIGLGRRADHLWGGRVSLPRQLLLGSAILFAAGGFPWLGQLLLFGVVIWSSGGAVLGFFAGDSSELDGSTRSMEAVDIQTLGRGEMTKRSPEKPEG